MSHERNGSGACRSEGIVSEPTNFAGRYGAVVATLLDDERLCELGPGQPNHEVRTALMDLSAETVGGGRAVRDPEMATACLAGLWLWHDFLDESHRQSQSVETPTGSYWHGIMHRREPDASNAKYWFRRVGDHPIHPELAATVGRMVAEGVGSKGSFRVDGGWDAARFVDACEEARGQEDAAEAFCREVQRQEWLALFDYSFRAAFGGE